MLLGVCATAFVVSAAGVIRFVGLAARRFPQNLLWPPLIGALARGAAAGEEAAQAPGVDMRRRGIAVLVVAGLAAAMLGGVYFLWLSCKAA